MNIGDWIVLAVVAVCFVLALYGMKKGKKSCNGDCGNCGSTCSKIDWDKIRKDIHDS